MKRFYVVVFVALFLSYSCGQPVYRHSSDFLQALQKGVDLNRYLGLWYEIYRLSNNFEKFNNEESSNVTATYSFNPDGKTIRVENKCKISNGRTESAMGVARVVEGDKFNSKLEVSFFRPFYGDYWILDLADDYSWAIVGEPKGKYLWILARKKHLDPNLEKQLLAKIEALGYFRNDLIKTVHD